MNTNFFANIAPILGSMNLTFTVAQGSDGGLIVSVLSQPKITDSAKENIVPMIIKGSIEELDEGFFDTIKEPIEKLSGITLQIKGFEEGAEKLAEESKAAAELKKVAKKSKEKVEKYLDETSKLIIDDKLDLAEKMLAKAQEISPDAKSVKAVAKELETSKGAKSQSSMFDLPGVKPEVETETKAVIDTESSHELENENNKIAQGMSEEHIDVIQQEQDDKWNLNNNNEPIIEF